MMSATDHARFRALLNQADVRACDDALADALLSAFSTYGLELELIHIVEREARTDFRVDRVLHLLMPHSLGTMNLRVRTMGLPDGRLCVYLVAVRISRYDTPPEEFMHLELFRSEPIADWRRAPDPTAALRHGMVSSGYLDCSRWPAVSSDAASKIDQVLQP